MTITTARPIVQGWYWFRDDPGNRWRMTEIYNGRAYGTWITESIEVERMAGEWAGPIPQPPKEATP